MGRSAEKRSAIAEQVITEELRHVARPLHRQPHVVDRAVRIALAAYDRGAHCQQAVDEGFAYLRAYVQHPSTVVDVPANT